MRWYKRKKNTFRKNFLSVFNSKKRKNTCMLGNMTRTKKYLGEKRSNRKKIDQLINEGV